AETQLSLDEALIVTDGASGHGWGLLAQKLGIDPGSNEFHALKARWTERKGALLGNTYFRGKADNDQGDDNPRGPKSNKSGKSDGSGPEPQSSGNRSGASASSGKK
ncbi:hypothetical protein ACOBQJ_16845, partial [Pelotomaculum propionicicum]|uniref:hypothetical protein n=1 Tax=Pelotomaculum propionicicum TaxID=258475 RepID=UPI003B77A672